MAFSSMSFLFFFLPALLLVYYVIPARLRGARNAALLVFSLFFYVYGGPRFLLLMLVSIAIAYICGIFAAPGYVPAIRKLALVMAVALGLGLLGWFKYSGFLAESINKLGASLPLPKVTLPLGISFYTFKEISFVIDVYRGEAKQQKNPLKVALYLTLFPQLVAGPIVRFNTIGSVLDVKRESFEAFEAGAVRFVFGLAKKILLANAMGEIANGLFGKSPGTLSVLTAWVGALAYTGQIYLDFSAYSDMAIGLSAMFGFQIPENFNYPYVAKSITEFWRRWHISLSSWFRDYLYIPLGGNRVSRLKHIRNIAVVWLLTGLWHGAAWTFILWGAWYGVLLLGEKYVWGSVLGKANAGIRHVYAMLLVIISWVFFRADTASQAFGFIGAMFGATGRLYDGQGIYYIVEYLPELIFGIIAVLPVKNFASRFLESRRSHAAGALLVWGPRVLGIALLALSYLKLVTGTYSPFIYFKF